jgi:hypothetical protein
MTDDIKRTGRSGPIKGSWKRRGVSGDAEVPVNLERILIMAAQDEQFRELLYNNRDEALSRSDIVFTASEQAVFNAMPRQMLEAMISRFKPARQRNLRFLKSVTAAAMAGGLIIASCADDAVAGGAGPDIDSDSDGDTDTDTDTDTDVDGGPDGG